MRGVLTDAPTSTFGYSVCPCHVDIGASNDISCFSSRQDGFQMCIYCTSHSGLDTFFVLTDFFNPEW